DGEFFEIYVDCPAEVCEGRDQKGVYKRARSGEIKNFTGISAPYEAPENPELIVRSNEVPVEEAVENVIRLVQQNNIIVSI
ncbi:MAG: adenylyl-sulfate kinase, partial [Pseudomonadota bacterium]